MSLDTPGGVLIWDPLKAHMGSVWGSGGATACVDPAQFEVRRLSGKCSG